MSNDSDPRISLVREVARTLEAKPFQPHPLFRSGHAQTLAKFATQFLNKSQAARADADESRLFEVEPGVQLLAHCRWHEDRAAHPTLVLVHGLEGSSASGYMLTTGDLAHRAGFNVVRLNQRNCGATEHLTPTLYHSGLSDDFKAVTLELVERDKLPRLLVAGFSMGGNLVLKMAGEFAERAPRALVGVCAVSPALNLRECCERIERRTNWVYEQSFLRSLRRRIRLKKKLFPAIYDDTDLRSVRTVRQFDERFTSRHGGFENAEDYYARASAFPVVAAIRVPTLIVHAHDDPIVPMNSFNDPSVAGNPYVIMLLPRSGGHCSFITASDDDERFWAESRVVEFCRLVSGAGRGEDEVNAS